MRKLVYIAYTFPPVTTGSAPMNLRLARIFPENGWELTVITPDHAGNLPIDPSLTDLVPDEVKVIRSGGSGSLRRGFRKSAISHEPQVQSQKRTGLRKFVLEVLLQPDRYVTWFPRAAATAIKEIQRIGADAVITLGPPHSTHLAGLACSRLTGIPWVGYFGDLWAKDGYIDWSGVSSARRLLTPLLEKAVVPAMDGIITTTVGSSAYFTERYGQACPPVQTLWNGVTSAERRSRWNPEEPRVPETGLTITYTGFFMGNQTPVHFLRGMRLFLERNPDSNLLFRIVGDFGAYSGLPAELGIENNVEILGLKPFNEVRRYQRESDLLLLILPPQPGNELKNPSKTVEYLLARRPVLAVSPEGDLTGLIEKLRAGYTADHEAGSVCQALESAAEDISAGRFRILRDPSELDGEMDMDEGGRRMTEFLNLIVERSR